jgi:hypothetical protein
MRATSAILIKLPKVNNHPLGENSPNLVALSAKNFLERSREASWRQPRSHTSGFLIRDFILQKKDFQVNVNWLRVVHNQNTDVLQPSAGANVIIFRAGKNSADFKPSFVECR